MSGQQMERARTNMRAAESRLAQLQKLRAKTLAQLQSAQVGPRPALHVSCSGIRRDVEPSI